VWRRLKASQKEGGKAPTIRRKRNKRRKHWPGAHICKQKTAKINGHLKRLPARKSLASAVSKRSSAKWRQSSSHASLMSAESGGSQLAGSESLA
jgi:hypothetical protein